MTKLLEKHRPGVEAIYPEADRFVDHCLATDGSLFTPGGQIWTPNNLASFKERFADAPDGTGSFVDQFEGQLDGADDGTIQLAAEMLYVHLLPVATSAIGAAKERELIEVVLSWGSAAVALPASVERALEGGLLKPGTNYATSRPRQISWLTRFAAAWKGLAPEVRDLALRDPWAFRDVVESTARPKDRALPSRRILLHLVHPDAFEAIAASDHRKAILAQFGRGQELTGDVDRDLLAVRASVAATHGDDFDWYRSPVHEEWKEDSGPVAPSPRDADEDGEGVAAEAEESESFTSLAELAHHLLMPVEFVKEVVDLLNDKKQIVLHGPPGTGKTYIARALARHLGADDSRTDLVQLHASYAYEDFVEGYRPVTGGGFDIIHGPLRRLAKRAEDNPGLAHVLVIDEMNRGNLAKVFGELYFLLEYRGEDITLQYSAVPFRLPENLWIIGTMNTADRSIALLDSALRRRFYFVELSPAVPPVSNLLRTWLERSGKPHLLWVADVVDRANELIGEKDAAIGPSYFMRGELDAAWVARIWEHAVLPLLAERFYGEEHRLRDFELRQLQDQVGFDPDGDRARRDGGRAVGESTGGGPGRSGRGGGAERTIHGRSLANIADGCTVAFRDVRATIESGRIVLDDGTAFEAPSTAARHVAGGTSLNGWVTWMVVDAEISDDGRVRQATLADLHDSAGDILWR